MSCSRRKVAATEATFNASPTYSYSSSASANDSITALEALLQFRQSANLPPAPIPNPLAVALSSAPSVATATSVSAEQSNRTHDQGKPHYSAHIISQSPDRMILVSRPYLPINAMPVAPPSPAWDLTAVAAPPCGRLPMFSSMRKISTSASAPIALCGTVIPCFRPADRAVRAPCVLGGKSVQLGGGIADFSSDGTDSVYIVASEDPLSSDAANSEMHTPASPTSEKTDGERGDGMAIAMARGVTKAEVSESFCQEQVEAALRSKPQRGKKRDNLNPRERLELTRTRNREHAKSTR